MAYRRQSLTLPRGRRGRILAPELLESRVLLDSSGLPGEVCYRVNVGGLQLAGSPMWTADTLANPSPYFNASTGNTRQAITTQAIDVTDPSIPLGTPAFLFNTDRFDQAGGTEMLWAFPVEPGPYEVRLYFADTFSGSQSVGAREFDVEIEGALVLDDYDIYADVGGFKGVVKSFIVDSDGTLNIDFLRQSQNPTLRGIEILVGGQVDGQLDVSTAAVNFGTLEMDTTAVKLVTLSNNSPPGGSSITIDPATAITVPGTSPFTATFAQTSPIVLAPGESTDVSLFYRPTTVGAAAALLSVAHNGLGSPVEISLVGTSLGPATGTPLYRVNAGGTQLADNPVWTTDTSGAPSPYLTGTSTNMGTISLASTIDMSDPSLPAGVPMQLFQSERFDLPNNGEMTWDFPVSPGTYYVRLYFSELFYLGSAGSRVFDVVVEGEVRLDNYDVFADVGGNAAVMKSLVVTTNDETLDIDFLHEVENPAIKGIEIIAASSNSVDVSTSTLEFGSVLVDSTSELPLIVTNNTDANVTIDPAQASITPGGTPFAFEFVQSAPIVLPSGGSTTVTVSYTPTTQAADTATLSIPHSGDNSPLTISLAGSGTNATTINFTKSTLALAGSLSDPTKLQFGPDGRLYVAELGGTIQILTVVRNGPNDYDVVAKQTLFDIKDTQNHDDQGNEVSAIGRLITGLLVTGTPQNPVMYVSHSDPRFGGGPDGLDLNLDTNSGMISRLTWNGSSWDRLDLVRGLPRSEENHGPNGLQLDPVENVLYLAIGGHTNMGARSNNFALLPEYALSAAILSIDLEAIGETTYDLPTLDDETRAGVSDFNDPFGGNDGLNQAKLVPGGPVEVYAPGFRNPYDILITSDGVMVTIDNGPNADWGDVPINEGPEGNATNAIHEPGVSYGDGFHIIAGPGYYGGHPNPTRSNPANTFNASNPQSPVSVANPIESDYQIPGVENDALHVFGSSTNGLEEYTAGNFGGALQGDILAASYSNTIFRVKLNAAGDGIDLVTPLFSNVGAVPLDVNAPTSIFAGSVWVSDIGTNQIYVFEPSDGGVGDPDDLDGDGYSNDDEIANGTDPQNGADVPTDNDVDFVSDLLDDDDDNDSILDVNDPFAIDAANGANTPVGTLYTWENDAPPAGGLLGLGFTGLMANGTTDWLDQYDIETLTPGGAAGVLTIDAANSGTALASANTQEQAFQFGVHVGDETQPYAARTRLVGPFNGLDPVAGQQMGVYIGTGDQDNYISLLVAGNDTLKLVREVAGVVTHELTAPLGVALPGPTAIDLWLSVNPATSVLQASYSINQGNRTDVFSELPVPAAWVASTMAVGLIAVDPNNSGAVPVTWDFLGVVTEPAPPTDATALFEIYYPTTFSTNAFRITNTSPGGKQIESIVIDLSTAVLPDAVFDPNGTAGDTTGKVFTPDSGQGATGLVSHSYSSPQGGGFDQLRIFFSDFDPGETFTFSIDTDPTSIAGVNAPGPNDSGSVSGFELSGSTITVSFDDGGVLAGQPFSVAGTDYTSRATLNDNPPATPAIALVGLSTLPAVVYDHMQTVRVTGPVGAEVRLVVAEGGLYLNGVPNGGFDIDPFEINTVLDFVEYGGTVGAGGTVDIPVSLVKSTSAGGISYIFAVVEDGSGVTSLLSNVAVVEYSDDPPPEVVYRINAGGPAIVGVNEWSADSLESPSPYNNAGAAIAYTNTVTAPVDTSSLPAGTPAELFASDRWDTADGEELTWAFPVPAGQYEVRLYFAESFEFGQAADVRLFDVVIEGNTVLDDYDIFAAAGGGYTGLMESFVVASDSTLDIQFIHVKENPLVNGIEIMSISSAAVIAATASESAAGLSGSPILFDAAASEVSTLSALSTSSAVTAPALIEAPLSRQSDTRDEAIASLYGPDSEEDDEPGDEAANGSLELALALEW